jgi:2-methylcitrate dehydratase PrpD
MPYTVSLVLEFGNLHDEQLDDRSVLERIKPLALRVTPKIDDTLSNANPNRLPGTIEITTKDGRHVVFEGHGHAESGDAFKQAVMDKYEMNCAAIDQKRRDRIAALVTALEAQPALGEISRLMRF